MTDTQPTMHVIQGRPLKIQMHLQGIDGVYVQCRLPNGQDAHVPLREIFELFRKEMGPTPVSASELARKLRDES